MNFTNENKLEQLERKVQELERKLEQKTSKDDSVREIEARLAGYQDHVRSDKGEIRLKKNFKIENRRGEVPGQTSPIDNAVTFSFDSQKKGRLNHIFIGTESIKGNNHCSVIQGVVVNKNDAPNIGNNGRIEFGLYNEEDFNNDGVLIPEKGAPQFQILSLKSFGLIGRGASLSGFSENGFASLVHADTSEDMFNNNNKYLSVTKDGVVIKGLPTSDPEVENAVWNDGGTLKISSGPA